MDNVKKVDIYFDGACNNKLKDPIMGIGIAVFIDGQYSDEYSISDIAKDPDGNRGTSNLAEWNACCTAIKMACIVKEDLKEIEINVFSDSQIITYQFNDRYNVNREEFKKYYEDAKEFALLAGIDEINWIPRKNNKEADRLSKLYKQQVLPFSYCDKSSEQVDSNRNNLFINDGSSVLEDNQAVYSGV